MGVPSPGDGLRFGDDLLAAVARLAEGRGAIALFNRGLDPINRATVRIRVPKARVRMLTAG